jgi:hypothetical protein
MCDLEPVPEIWGSVSSKAELMWVQSPALPRPPKKVELTILTGKMLQELMEVTAESVLLNSPTYKTPDKG